VATKDVEFTHPKSKNNITFKKGDKLLISPYVMGRLPEYWGGKTNDFKPDSFVDKGNAYIP
jgi:cytochrome P450